AFGLAELYERRISDDALAPEAAANRWDEVDAQTDLWAVGATLALLAGGHASDLSPLAPPVAEGVRTALAADQRERWPGAGAMSEALRQGVALALGVSAGPPEAAQGVIAGAPPAQEVDANEELDWAPAIGRRRSRRIALVGALGAVAITVPLFLLYWHSKTA